MENQPKEISTYSILFLILIGIVASLLIFWVTDFAIGVTPDSTVYIDTAKNILAGNGITSQNKPMTHYPPGYPTLLALVSIFQPDNILQNVRILHVVLFGCNVFLVGLTIKLCTNNSISAIGYTVLGFLSSYVVITSHAKVWSDPPFIILFLIAFILLTWYSLQPRWYLLILISIIVAIAIMVRFIGVTLVPPIIFALLLFEKRSLKLKIRDIIAVILVTLLPLVFWFGRNLITAKTLANRKNSFQFLGFHLSLNELFARIYDFAFPILIPEWAKSLQLVFLLIVMIIGIFVLYKRNYLKQNLYSSQLILPSIYVFFFITYISFLIFSQLFIEVRLAWDTRILLPAFLSLVFIFISLIWSLAQILNKKALWLSLFFVTFVSIGINGFITISQVNDLHINGQGYTSRNWQNSETIQALEIFNIKHKIYSNGPDVIYFYTSIETDMIPRKNYPSIRQSNLKYKEQINQVCTEIKANNALLVYLENVNRNYLPDSEEIEMLCNLPVLQKFKDGVIYGTNE